MEQAGTAIENKFTNPTADHGQTSGSAGNTPDDTTNTTPSGTSSEPTETPKPDDTTASKPWPYLKPVIEAATQATIVGGLEIDETMHMVHNS